MKHTYQPSGIESALDPITGAFFWRSKEDTLLKVDLDVDATDTNTKAEGTRSVKRGETLKMVHGKQAGETRRADVKLSIDSPVNIPLPSDFPQCKGPGKVEESNGQLTAQYNGNQSGNITVNPFSANAAMQAINVVLVPENEVTHERNFDSEQFEWLQSGQAHTITNPSRSQIRL